jgi:hypothetical protein
MEIDSSMEMDSSRDLAIQQRMDMSYEHGNAAKTCSMEWTRTCSMEWTWTCSMDMDINM